MCTDNTFAEGKDLLREKESSQVFTGIYLMQLFFSLLYWLYLHFFSTR